MRTALKLAGPTLGLLVSFCSTARAAGVVIIANNSVAASGVSEAEIKQIFLGEVGEIGGVHIVPATLADGVAAQTEILQLVGKSDSAFRATWRKQVFEGKAAMPRSFPTEAALIAYIAATPGAVGYVASGHPAGVKVLALK